MRMIDRFDMAILSALQRDGQMTRLKLSEVIGLSQTPCHERVKRLENDQLITCYNAKIDINRVIDIQFFYVFIQLSHHDLSTFNTFETTLINHPQIIECHALGGTIDYIVKVIAKDLEAFKDIARVLFDEPKYMENYTTHIVTKSILGNVRLPLETLMENRM